MEDHPRTIRSPHKIVLSSTIRDFLRQKRSVQNEQLFHIHHNQISIKNAFIHPKMWKAIGDEDFKRIMNEITKKVNLYKVKGFDSLALNLNSCPAMTNESVRFLRHHIIKNFLGLKKLSLSLIGYSRISKEGVKQISHLISGFKDLRSLELRFLSSVNIRDKVLNGLIRKIHKSQKYLENFHLDLSSRLENSDGDILPTEPDLFQRLTHTAHEDSYQSNGDYFTTEGLLRANFNLTKYFRSLKELNLNFALNLKAVTNEICKELGRRILEKMENLKILTLNFNGCEKLTNEALRLFSPENCKKRKLKALEQLTLEFSDLGIDDEGLGFLEEGISEQFKDLRKLTVNLMQNYFLTDNDVRKFNNTIVKNLPFLQAFTLACYGIETVDGENMKAVSRDISQNLKDLKELGLIFSNVNPDGLGAICSEWMQSSIKLQKLTLLLNKNAFKDIVLFQQALNSASLKDLKELNLDFSGNDSVDNDCIMELGKSLQGLVLLKKLALSFIECDSIGRVVKKQREFRLGVLIPKAVKLDNFEIFFTKCSRIKDEMLEEFGESLCEFQRGLKVMHVSFSKCTGLTEKGYERFCIGIRENMTDLEDLTLNFFECKQISQELKTEMKILFKNVPIATLY